MSAISTGHSVQLCHRCGWPFPNPHPSAKHRRSHKRICGTVEGYEIVHSEEHDPHLALLDDEHGSGEDEHTPNPKILKKAVGEFGSSGSGIGAKSNRSEGDVFSDAVTEFSDSGISPRLEERFESVMELDKSLQQKSLEAHFDRSQSLYFDTTADTTEQVNDPTRSAQGASAVGIITGLQPDFVESGITRDDVVVDNISEYSNGKSLEKGHMNEKSPAITLGSEEGIIPDPALSFDASNEALRDKLVSNVVKHDQTETLQTLDVSAEISDSIKTVGEIPEGRILDPVLSADASKEELCDKLVSDVVKHDQTETLQNTDTSAKISDSIKVVGEITEGRIPDPVLSADASKEDLCDMLVSDVVKHDQTETHHNMDVSAEISDSIETIDEIPEGLILDPALSADASKEELCDKRVSDEVKHDQTEAHQTMDASAEISDPIKIVGEIAPFVETHESDVSVRAEEVFYSNEDIVSIGAVALNTSPEEILLSKPDGIMQTSSSVFATEQSEAKPVVSSIDKKVELDTHVAGGDTIAGNSGANEGNMGGTEHWNPDKDNSYVDTVAYKAFECGDGDDRLFKKNVVNHSEENSSCKILGTTNEKGEGASVKVQSTVDPTNSTDLPSSADLHESFTTESRNNGFDKHLEGLGTNNFTEVPQPVFVYADLNRDIIGDISDIKYSPPKNIHVTTGNVVGVESVDAVGIITELKDNNRDEAVEVESQGTPPEQKKSELLSKDDSTYIISEGSAGVLEESIDAAQVKAKLNNHNGDEDNPREHESSTIMKKSLNGTSADVGAELTSLSNAVVDVGNETCAANSVTIVHSDNDAMSTGANSNSLQTKADDELTSHKVGVAVMDLSANNSNSRSDSMEGNCGSVSDALETDSRNPKAATEEANADKSTFEPPSFMTLVQSGGEGCPKVDAAVSEIETENNNKQRPKADALEAGWFPSLTNVVNESECRKRNEEIIAKVTKWSPVKQHGSLKNLLNEVKSPRAKHIQGETDESKDDGAGVATAAVGPIDEKDTQVKDMEHWNSPARYPIEIKKEKKKGKSYWVPFVCCSSVHRDL